MSREQTKAAHYIQQLDEARCQGNWDAVPELVRKVRKHAPNRTCLALTAESEHAVSQVSLNRRSTPRPPAAVSAQPEGISRYIPQLLQAIERNQTSSEDRFQAAVCLGWIHWELGEPALAASRLPKNIEEEFSQLDSINKSAIEWSMVCALKATYIKGAAQAKGGAAAEALEALRSALPVLSATPSASYGKELRFWKELYLTEFCMVSSNAIRSSLTPVLEAETLSAFRAWDQFWDAQAPAATGGRAIQADVPRRRVWKEYYMVLSYLLRQGLPYPTTPLAVAYVDSSARSRQRADLKRVEARYKTLLLSEVQFPKSDQASEEVETFVEIAIQNWCILCGSDWKEHDLGEGGSEGVSRGILDLLYQAATKTFHSTAVLRHLFSVHLAIAEFELAFKAFDTYLDIVTKGKARVEKTGKSEHGLDDDETVLETISKCINALCRFGSRQGTERARELGQYLTNWLDKYGLNGQRDGNEPSNGVEPIVSPTVLATVWRCIGIGHAQWAQETRDASTRDEVQLQAIACFRTALSPRYASSVDVETLFALATILAERRELGSAIEVLRIGLLPPQSSAPLSTSKSDVAHGIASQSRRFAREKSLIPLWHLMALLLSARQEFFTAVRSCEGAFEQFQDTKYLFGEQELNKTYQSDHLNGNFAHQNTGVVDYMDDFEKDYVLEVKITQLTLLEALEGPEVAVNASDELLSLYSRLFGDAQRDPSPILTARANQPPKSSAGTVRSIRGSIFGKSARKPNSLGATPNEKADIPSPHTTKTIANVVAPTIQVTEGNESVDKQIKNSNNGTHRHEKLQKRNGSVSRKRSSSIRKRSSSTSQQNIDAMNAPLTPTTATAHIDNNRGDKDELNRGEHEKVGLALTTNPSTQPLPLHSKQVAHKEPISQLAHANSRTMQDNRPSQTAPCPTSARPMMRFPKDQEIRGRKAILVKVWLFISGFYRRASMFDDAKGAIDEAQKLIETLEVEVSKEQKGSIPMQHPGWGGWKSVSELWSDVFSERGSLAIAECSPYIALEHFESALASFADHPSAIVGLSNLLLDIYTEDLLPPTPVPPLAQPNGSPPPLSSTSTYVVPSSPQENSYHSVVIPPSTSRIVPPRPLGLPSPKSTIDFATVKPPSLLPEPSDKQSSPKESSTVLLDRLAARDRAYGLLSKLTKLGSGWNYSEAWFALARAYDEGGQPEKARQALWWCVELEEGRGVRNWRVVGGGK